MEPTRTFSRKMEEDVAKKLGGQVVANSGATLMYKGDVRTDVMLVECKTVTKPQSGIRLEKNWIEQIRKQSLDCGKYYSAVAVRFEPDGKNFYVIDEGTMQFLIEKIREEENGSRDYKG